MNLVSFNLACPFSLIVQFIHIRFSFLALLADSFPDFINFIQSVNSQFESPFSLINTLFYCQFAQLNRDDIEDKANYAIKMRTN